MQNGNHVSFNSEVDGTNCAFCRRSHIASKIIKETRNFLLVADHAPLVEGHLLIIPKQHYACYGAVPATLDAEFLALKGEVRQFLARFYAPVVYWEHGVFRQTVFHAHLHCFPFGATDYSLADEVHDAVVHSQEDIRTWYATRGQYFYMEDLEHAFLFSPETERYFHIIQHVFGPGLVSQGRYSHRRSPQQRYEEGPPLIEAVAAKWRIFQQQGFDYAEKSSAR
jgi:diadenosine tetraphosphate (Ap4A) HIT family hydrolase